MKVACIVVAAGKGKRLNSKIKKPYIKLGKRPILAHSLASLSENSGVDDIIVVVARKDLGSARALVKRYMFDKVKDVVCGGKTRFGSVRKGLKKIGKGIDIVLVHDGARPFLERKVVDRVIRCAGRFGGAVSAVPLKATIKKTHEGLIIKETPERRFLWEAQTPQGFRKDIILSAYFPHPRGVETKTSLKNPTDDASLVEKMGYKVRIVKGSYRNIKITTPEDLRIAKALLGGKS